MSPADLPHRIAVKSVVTHAYPDGWDEAEQDEHRYDECPCSPTMTQCLGCHGYHWVVYHKRIPKTEKT